MSAVVDEIRSRGYWDVVIRPKAYDEERVDYSQLDELVIAAVVRMRGWPVPFFDHEQQPIRGESWIGQDIDASSVGHYEAWRFHTSGQFSHLRAIGADWRGESVVASGSPPRDKVVEVWEILFYLTEVFEFAARLALGPAGDETMTVNVGLHGLDERDLIVGQPNRAPFFEPYRTGQNELNRSMAIARGDLVAEPRGLAAEMALQFFARFGWNPARDQLLDHQRELTAT